ncbi:MAG: CoA transferase [Myxococcota bacterium]
MTAAGPLAALRVLDLTDLRGALCARVLADLGADVLRAAPATDAEARDPAHLYRNANKRGIALELDAPGARERVDALCAEVDVVVENLGPARAAALGLGAAALDARHPALVHVALSDFGASGPRRDWRLEPLPAFAASGALYQCGFPTLPPCWLPGHVVHDCASIYGAAGAVAAWMERERSGRGQTIDVSAQEAGYAGLYPWAMPLADYHAHFPMLPSNPSRAADGMYLVLPAKDGHVRIVLGNPKHWQAFLALARNPDVIAGPEWDQAMYRVANQDVIRLVARERLTDRTRAELFEEARALGVPLGAIQRPDEFVAHAQSAARGTFLRTGHPHLGDAPFVAPPLRLSATPSSLRRAAPAPGDDDAVAPRGATAPSAAGAGAGAAARAEPLLAGVRVVEFGVAAVVPELCFVLSELGAEVIKVESLAHLDVLRIGNADGNPNHAWTFNDECRGRESVALDLGTARGRELAHALCARADVVAENHRGGVLDALGLGYESVRASNPGVVYVSSQGYGRGGPLDAMPAFGPLNSAFAGLHALWNHPDAPYPCGSTLNHPDHIAGKLLAVAVLAALQHRARTGEGQRIELAQTEAAAYLAGEIYLQEALGAGAPVASGNRSERAVPHDVYPAAGADRWLAIAAPDDAAWRRLEVACGFDPDPALATLAGRLAKREAVDARLAAWTRERDALEAAAHLQAAGVSAMPVQGPDEQRADAHLLAREAIVTVAHADLGPERHIANPLRMSRTPLRTAAAAPLLGADTEAVLGRVLGLAADAVRALRDEGVCR